jgi:hypothetical protein
MVSSEDLYQNGRGLSRKSRIDCEVDSVWVNHRNLRVQF